MVATALLVSALLAQSAAVPVADTPSSDYSGVAVEEVAYQELANGQPEAAIAKLEESSAFASGDPAALINLGNAHARLGQTKRALELYQRAIESDVRYDLELADGRWMDSRRAAQKARDGLMKRNIQAMRQ